MKTLADYTNPFDAILEFEQLLKQYTGAPYAVVCDSCSHAIEMVFKSKQFKHTKFPSRTYLSVLMTMHKVGTTYELTNKDWFSDGYYNFEDTNVVDCARHFRENMFQSGKIQCISFGMTKPLEIGLGGCVLTDDRDLAEKLNRMRYDGRDIFKYKRWVEQNTFDVGYHYYLRPEECIIGINKLTNRDFTEQKQSFFNYPDCKDVTIVD